MKIISPRIDTNDYESDLPASYQIMQIMLIFNTDNADDFKGCRIFRIIYVKISTVFPTSSDEPLRLINRMNF